MKPSPLRIVVLYNSGHLGSTILLNKLMRMSDYKVVGLVKAQTIHTNSKGLKKLKNHCRRLGWKLCFLLAAQSFMQSCIYLLTLFLPRRLRPAWRLAQKNRLPVFDCQNINDLDCQDFIKALQPDLMISAYFPQILKKDVIALPSHGTLNIHPGWLPSYQGAMTYFWALKQGAPRAGVSLHWIDEGIDTGALIERKSFSLSPQMTQEQVLVKTAFIGASLLQRAGKSLRQQKQLPALLTNEAEQYYSLPDKASGQVYLKKHRFFRSRDLFGIMTRTI